MYSRPLACLLAQKLGENHIFEIDVKSLIEFGEIIRNSLERILQLWRLGMTMVARTVVA